MKKLLMQIKVFAVLLSLMNFFVFTAPAQSDPLWHKRCHGTGFIPCHVCHGDAAKAGHFHCPECRDTGKVKCRRCQGTGILFSFVEIQKA